MCTILEREATALPACHGLLFRMPERTTQFLSQRLRIRKLRQTVRLCHFVFAFFYETCTYLRWRNALNPGKNTFLWLCDRQHRKGLIFRTLYASVSLYYVGQINEVRGLSHTAHAWAARDQPLTSFISLAEYKADGCMHFAFVKDMFWLRNSLPFTHSHSLSLT